MCALLRLWDELGVERLAESRPSPNQQVTVTAVDVARPAVQVNIVADLGPCVYPVVEKFWSLG